MILAERSGVGAIRFCQCNCVQVSLGAVTINMKPEMFAKTALLLKEAMESLSAVLAAAEPDGTQPSKPN